jgi:hypothetical protein
MDNFSIARITARNPTVRPMDNASLALHAK